MFTVAARSFVGARKAVNQDACCALTAESSFGEAALICVCDGVGGLASGELASSAAVREIAGWFENRFPAYAADNLRNGTVDLEGVGNEWEELLTDLNERMLRYSRDLNVRMGTTFTALLACGGSFVIGHVGDCRAYLLRMGSLRQLTRDQTWVQRQVDAGRIAAQEAAGHPRAAAIWQAVGAQEALKPEFGFGELEDGDTLAICCDGLYRLTGNDGVGTALRMVPAGACEPELVDALDTLASRAIDAGEEDNLTGSCLSVSGHGAAAGEPCPDDEQTICLAAVAPPA